MGSGGFIGAEGRIEDVMGYVDGGELIITIYHSLAVFFLFFINGTFLWIHRS